MSLTTLPTELLYMLTDSLPLADISSLARTSVQLYLTLSPLIRTTALHPRHSLGALFCAAANHNAPMARYLLANSPDLTVAGSTPTEVIPTEPEELLAHVLSKGANLILHKNDGSGHAIPALHWAIHNSRRAMIRLLLDMGADLDARYSMHIVSGPTALHEAARRRDGDTMRLLLKRGVSPNVRSHRSLTPLHIAATKDHVAGARLLLQYGGETGIVDAYGFTPMLEAERHGAKNVARLLLEAEDPRSYQDQYGRNVLHLAAIYGHVELVRSLLEQEDIDVNSRDGAGRAAIHYAAREGDAKIVDMLVKRGASVSVKDYSRSTALHYAARRDMIAVTQLLLEAGAGVEAKDKYGKTPLHLAASQGARVVSNFLLKKGAKIMEQDASGKSALHMVGQYYLKLVSEKTACR